MLWYPLRLSPSSVYGISAVETVISLCSRRLKEGLLLIDCMINKDTGAVRKRKQRYYDQFLFCIRSMSYRRRWSVGSGCVIGGTNFGALNTESRNARLSQRF